MTRERLSLLFCLILPFALATSVLSASPPPPQTTVSPLSLWISRGSLPAPPLEAQSQTPSLLVNGNFDELPFYWVPPNHHIAGGWMRWWIHGTVLPEFDDVRTSRPYYDGGHAQAYFKWGASYEAGIYQVVSGLTPCVPYRFTMWARNHSSLEGGLPRARIGLDPEGTQLTPRSDEGAVPDPPGLPPKTVWSREQTALFVWEELAVEAEPLGNQLTAILYAHPDNPGDGFFDTYWDAGRLITSTFPGGRLPAPVSWAPTSFITNVTISNVLNTLIIEWNTLAPAPAQVWYNIIQPASPITPTAPHTHTVYLPLVLKSPSAFAYATPIDISPLARYRAVISGLEDGETVQFVVVARRPSSGACVTEVTESRTVTVQVPPIHRVYLPVVLSD